MKNIDDFPDTSFFYFIKRYWILWLLGIVAVVLLVAVDYNKDLVVWSNQKYYDWLEENPDPIYVHPYPRMVWAMDESTYVELGYRKDGVVVWRYLLDEKPTIKLVPKVE